MREQKRSVFERIMALLLSIMLVVALMPIGSLGEVQADEIVTNTYEVTTSVVDSSEDEIDGVTASLTDLNGVVIDDATQVEEGTSIKLKIEELPTEYYIDKVLVNGKEDTSVSISSDEKAIESSWTIEEATTIQVVVVEKYTVTNSTTDTNGSVTITDANGSTVSSGDLVVDGTGTLKVAAEEGYRIKSVVINDVEEETIGSNDSTFEKLELVDGEDVEVVATFQKTYTVEVEYDSNTGTVSLNDNSSAGSVVVDENSSDEVKIMATPNTGYHVSAVKINTIDKSVDGTNDSDYETTLSNISEDYTIAITFALNTYSISYDSDNTDHGGLVIDETTVEYNDNTTVTIEPEEGYTVDTLSVNDQDYTSEITKDESGSISFELENITEDQVITVEFKEVAEANIGDITIDSADALRVVDNELYVMASGSKIEISTEKLGMRVLDDEGNTIIGDESTQAITITSNTSIAMIQLYYQDDDEYYADWHGVARLAEGIEIVVDESAPSVDLGAKTEPNSNGYYNDNIEIEINVEDEEEYSGIAKVEYWIDVDGVDNSSETTVLYEYDSTISSSYDGGVELSATEYNSDEVTIYVLATDRAGNETKVSLDFMINSTAPTVEVELDGQESESAASSYYGATRTMTITIVDRDDTFDSDIIATDMKFTKDGEEYEPTIEWTKDEESTEGIQIGTITFDENATYAWDSNYVYTNKAGLCNDSIVSTSGNVYKFTVDTVAPSELSISYSDSSIAEQLISDFQFYQAKMTVTIKATDATAGIYKLVYEYDGTEITVEEKELTIVGDVASYTFEIEPEYRGEISMKAIDKSGNTTLYDGETTIVIDSIAPDVTVSYDNNDVKNSSYYTESRVATITIEESNFFEADIDDEYLVIEIGIYDDENEEYEYKTLTDLEFEANGEGSYEETIEFADGEDYILKINYTDRSGNAYEGYEQAFTIDTVDPEVEVSFDNNTCLNTNQFDEDRIATIVVEEHNFDASKVALEVKVNGVVDSSYQTYIQTDSNWLHDGDTHTITLEFVNDGHYTFKNLMITDESERTSGSVDYGTSVKPNEFTIDKTAPTDLDILYSSTVLDSVLETLTFGFYDAQVTVTLEATDVTSGIDYYTYSYEVQDGASTVNTGATDVIIYSSEMSVDTETGKATATFTIPEQYRGYVSFVATDMSGNSTEKVGDKVIVVDTIAPGITVEYDNNDVSNGQYYDADRTATITIEEANFFTDDIAEVNTDEYLVITVKKTLNDGTYSETIMTPEFTKVSGTDQYVADIVFDENADYELLITYTDRSSNEAIEYSSGEFTIDKINPVLSIDYDNMTANNDTYYKADRTAIITVVEHNFDAKDIAFTIEAVDVSGNIIDLSSKSYADYLMDNDNWTKSTTEADTWTAEILIDIEGNYSFKMLYKDLAENSQAEMIEESFCVDKTQPSDTTISYSTSVLGKILETITFGFYNAPVTVTLEAVDVISGVDYITYSYDVQQNVSDVNTGESNIVIESSDLTYSADNTTAMFSFVISGEFRGNVSFVATDMADNSSELCYDDTVIVVDTMAPVVEVSYDNYEAQYDSYYNANRTATITINEANYFEDALLEGELLIVVEETDNNGTYVSTNVQPEFTQSGDVYTATVEFATDADYTFDIQYTDYSGNEYDAYEKDEFTVDKTSPEISVTYDNNSSENTNQFNADREATIVITEHNFLASDVIATITADGEVVDDYSSYLQIDSNWTHDGDVHTATIQFTNEAHYTFDIEYTDMAGNANNTVDYGYSVAPTVFTLDKTAPTELTIEINDISVLGTNSVAFDTYYAEQISVKLSANCDISGIDTLSYQKVPSISEYDIDGNWTEYDDATGIIVSPSEKFVIYFRAEDRAGNVTIVNSTGIVVDNQMPTGEIEAPDIDIIPEDTNENGMYNSDVSVDITVVDPSYQLNTESADGYYSGLNEITYKIYTTDTDEVEEGTLLDKESITAGATYDDDSLISGWDGTIIIDSDKFNSNNVIVEIVATDNAGNTRTSITSAGDIKIDTTRPTIEISYSNNSADSDQYFDASRTATIIVTERNFDSEDVEITITNTDGAIPSISSWSKVKGSGNADDTTWQATITYSADGDYEFDIDYVDMADNVCRSFDYGDSVAPTAFTIDQVNPVISVSYDNDNVTNESYYSEIRTATVTVTEHNLDPNDTDASRVVITMTATDDGESVSAPTVSSWSRNGDTQTATISYSSDALYTFDVEVTDKAGNVADDFTEQTFYVDTTIPTLEISGVEDLSANNGEVAPVVTYSDTNIDVEQVEITLSGANRNDVELIGSYSDITNGQVFTFVNFEELEEIDDIYTLEATLIDKAGNEIVESITFSVNRFGSTYSMNDETEKLNTTYAQEAIDVVVYEINPDPLDDVKITLFKNNETITLEENSDYEIELEGGNGEWYKYTYTIYDTNFIDDGVYRLTFYSEDGAGNIAENTLDTKNMEIGFGIDKTSPNVLVSNLESNTTYALDSLDVNMSVSDNLSLSSVVVYLDGDLEASWDEVAISELIETGSDYSFTISGESTSSHTIMVLATDAAGNEYLEEISDFYVTTNLWIRYYTNKILFYGSIAGAIALAGGGTGMVMFRRKKLAIQK